jgi:hypothetical protein
MFYRYYSAAYLVLASSFLTEACMPESYNPMRKRALLENSESLISLNPFKLFKRANCGPSAGGVSCPSNQCCSSAVWQRPFCETKKALTPCREFAVLEHCIVLLLIASFNMDQHAMQTKLLLVPVLAVRLVRNSEVFPMEYQSHIAPTLEWLR